MEQPKRKNYRLRGYNYAQDGGYFITICVRNHECLLWAQKAVGASFARPCTLSPWGAVIDAEIQKIDKIYGDVVKIDDYVIMPNHIHMIVLLQSQGDGGNQEDGRAKLAPTVPTISRIVQQFKGSITKQIGQSIWQKLYYDEIIRDEQMYLGIRKYIEENPLQWELDEYYAR